MGFANPRPGLAISAGTGFMETGTAVLSNSGGVTFGMSLSASSYVVTASAASAAGGVSAISAGTTQITSGTVVLSNSNALSLGMSGQMLTARFGSISYWDNSAPESLPPGTSWGVLGLQRVSFGMPITVTRADVILRVENAGAINVATTVDGSFSLLAYTLNRSTASLASSGTITLTWIAPGGGAGQTVSEWSSIALGTWVLTPGEYIFGTLGKLNSLTVGISTLSNLSIDCAGRGNPVTIRNPGGGNFSAYWADGTYSATTVSAPGSIQLSEVVQTFTQVYAQALVRLLST